MGFIDWLNDRGEDIAQGFEAAVEWTGDRVEDGFRWTADRADDIGWEGGRDFLNDAGTEVASFTGAEVDELELGQTSDPKDLIVGEPDKIQEKAEKINTVGTSLLQTGDALAAIDVAEWTGDGAEAFRALWAQEPGYWDDAHSAFSDAYSAMTAFADEISAAQDKAQTAIDLWDAAERKQAAYDALSEEEKAASTLDLEAAALREQANDKLRDGRTGRDNAVGTFSGAMDAATALAPEEPPFINRLAADAADASQIFSQHGLSFVDGFLTGATGTVGFLRSINPTDSYNVSHPYEYASRMSDLGTGLVTVAADPGAATSAIVQQIKEDPAKAAGAATFEILTAVATGGSSIPVKGGVKALDTAGDAARLLDTAGDTTRLVDTAGDATRLVDTAGDASRAADSVGDLGRATDSAADAGRALTTTGDAVPTGGVASNGARQTATASAETAAERSASSSRTASTGTHSTTSTGTAADVGQTADNSGDAARTVDGIGDAARRADGAPDSSGQQSSDITASTHGTDASPAVHQADDVAAKRALDDPGHADDVRDSEPTNQVDLGSETGTTTEPTKDLGTESSGHNHAGNDSHPSGPEAKSDNYTQLPERPLLEGMERFTPDVDDSLLRRVDAEPHPDAPGDFPWRSTDDLAKQIFNDVDNQGQLNNYRGRFAEFLGDAYLERQGAEIISDGTKIEVNVDGNWRPTSPDHIYRVPGQDDNPDQFFARESKFGKSAGFTLPQKEAYPALAQGAEFRAIKEGDVIDQAIAAYDFNTVDGVSLFDWNTLNPSRELLDDAIRAGDFWGTGKRDSKVVDLMRKYRDSLD